ncbi:MAG: tetratricopeptide repeat protein, partial [Planctomycetaceae bacterium]
ARHRPHLVQPTREHWQQEIQRLDPVNHAGERLVHQVEFVAAAGLPEEPALQTVRQFFDQRPDDLATRRRVAEVLVRRGQTASPDNATSALAQTRLAIDLVLSASEPWRTSQEGRSLLAEAYRAEAAILRAQGSLSTARQSLEVALSHSPDDRRAALFLDLVQLHLDLGDRTQAESILTRIGEGTEARAQAERLLQEASQIETRSP